MSQFLYIYIYYIYIYIYIYNIIYICHRHGIWVKEKMERFGCSRQSCHHPLNCQAWWFLEVSDYLSPRLEASPHLRGSPVGGI